MSLPRERTDRGDCLSYFAHGQESIHNANMLGAAALARAARQHGREDYADVARVGNALQLLDACSPMAHGGMRKTINITGLTTSTRATTWTV